MEVSGGLTDRLVWPTTRLTLARPEGLGRDLILVHGIEPNMRWRAFSDELVAAFSELGTDLVILLGALLADSPHTRPVPVSAAAADAKLSARLHVDPVDYKGPTGIVGVLQHACHTAGVPAVSLWAAVPHYVQLTPSPRAAKALCDRLAGLLDLPIDTTELEEASEAYIQQVSEAVAADEETAAYVDELESRAEELEEDLPSGDSLAAELTRYLREREQNGDPPPAAES